MAKERPRYYPLYHCKSCGHYFRDRKGIYEDPLRGQQSEVVDIEKCAKYCGGGK